MYAELHTLRSKIRELEKSGQQREQRIDMLRYQIDEIEAAQLQPGEEEMLTERRQFFENAGQLAYSLQAASKLLSGSEEDDGAMDLLSRAADELADVAALSQDLNNLSQKAEEVRYQVEDLAASVAMLAADVDFSPKERDAVEERLDVIYRLRRKYGATLEEVLSYHDKASKELGELENADDRKDEMMEEYHRTLPCAREIASEFS